MSGLETVGGNIERAIPMFSVVIPTFNSSGTIMASLESVFSQTFPDFEVIVVDDASTDGTPEMVSEAYGDRVKLLRKIMNTGASATRNLGMDTASGRYLAFLDADDQWHHEKLQLVNTILEAAPATVFLYHQYTLENISDKSLPDQLTLFKLPFIKLLSGNKIATPCAVLKNVPELRFDTTMRYCEDYDLWLRVAYKFKVFFIDIPLTQLSRPVLSSGGVSQNKWKMRRGEMKAYRHLLRLNPLFLFLLPFLWLSSLVRHLGKMIIGK